MLEIKNLTISYQTDEGNVLACEDVSASIKQGEIVGIVGESGCGKSTVAKALLRLLPPNAIVESGEIMFKGKDLLSLSNAELRKIRWNEISTITQTSMDAFDPVYTIGHQIIEAIQAHEDVTKKVATERSRELLRAVSMDPARMKDYPHQLSGGMKQRALIAMSLALNPSLLIADEPTTALDVITQHSILKELLKLKEELSNTLIMISHDIGVISEMCDKVFVMYAGNIVESGPTNELFSDPYHPYTLGLRNAFPDIGQDNLISIPGTPPQRFGPSKQCQFAPRCPFAISECTNTEPELFEISENHYSRCIRHDIHAEMIESVSDKSTWLNSLNPDGGPSQVADSTD